MRFMSQTKRRQLSTGFTLIEVLVIAPIVVLVIGGFVALIMALVGDVLVTRDQNVMAYETQDALDRIEQDTRIGTQFLDTSRTLPAPQGSDDGVAAFSSSNALIMGALATDKNPASSDRQLIYYANQPAACGSSTQSQNRVFINKIIYYVKNGSLWRRIVVPPYNTNNPVDALTVCDAPWQQNSCTPGYTLVPPCQTNDSEIMKNIESLQVKYYSSPSGNTELTGANILSATTIDVTINGKRTSAGKEATSSGTVRASKLNSIDADVPPPTSPIISHIVNTTPVSGVSFSWSAVPYATSYNISYRINAGTWTNTTVSSGTTAYTAPASRTQTVSIKVASVNAAGTSPDANDSASLPAWINLELQNGWTNYLNTFDTAQYTKSSDGRVFLKGLIRFGATATDTVIANLPAGYRPTGRLVFQTATDANVSGRIDVESNGNVTVNSGSTGWLSLDTISFLPSTSTYTWNTMPFQNGWSNWLDSFEPVHATKDSIGRVNMQGLAKAGSTGNNVVIAQTDAISTTYRPALGLYIPAGAAGFDGFEIGSAAGQIINHGAQTSVYMGLQALYYPGSLGTWTNLTYQSSWVSWGTASFPALQYTKAADNVVTVRGMIKNGSTAVDAVIATLPVGARPLGRQIFAISSWDAFSRIDVLTNGEIRVAGPINNGWAALNFSFIAD